MYIQMQQHCEGTMLHTVWGVLGRLSNLLKYVYMYVFVIQGCCFPIATFFWKGRWEPNSFNCSAKMTEELPMLYHVSH